MLQEVFQMAICTGLADVQILLPIEGYLPGIGGQLQDASISGTEAKDAVSFSGGRLTPTNTNAMRTRV